MSAQYFGTFHRSVDRHNNLQLDDAADAHPLGELWVRRLHLGLYFASNFFLCSADGRTQRVDGKSENQSPDEYSPQECC